MAVTLGTLLLEVGLDLERYQADMEEAKARAAEFGAEMSRIYNNADVKPPSGFKDTQDQFERSPLKPVVDMSELYALNAEFDKKQMHHISLQMHFERNHLTPRVDDSELVDLNNTLDLIRGKLEREYKLKVTADGMADVERQLQQQQGLRRNEKQTPFNPTRKQPDLSRTGYLRGTGPSTDSYYYDLNQKRFRYADGPMKGRYAKTSDALPDGLLALSDKLDRIRDDIKDHKGTTVKNTVQITNAIRDQDKKGFLEKLFDIPKELVGNIVTGATEGIGLAVSAQFSQGMTDYVEKKTGKSFYGLGRTTARYGYGRGMEFLQVAGKSLGYKDGAKGIFKDIEAIGERLDNFLDPRKFVKNTKALEDLLVGVLEDIHVYQDRNAATSKIASALKPGAEGIAESGMRMAGVGLRIGAYPMKIRKRVLLAQSMELAKQLAEQIEVPDIEDIDKKDTIVISTGGIDGDEDASNTAFSRNMVQSVFGEGAEFVPVQNTYSNAGEFSDQYKGIRNAIIDGLKALGVLDDKASQEMKESYLPVDRLMEVAIFAGFNPDSIAMEATRLAYQKKYGEDKNFVFTGSSGGTAAVEEAVSIAERGGAKNTKGIGLTLPTYQGLVSTASKENFRAFAGTLDPLYMASFGSSGYSEEEKTKILKGLDEEIRKWEKAIAEGEDPEGFDPSMIKTLFTSISGLMSPGELTEVIEGAGAGHNLALFLAHPEVQKQVQEFLKGYLTVSKDSSGRKAVKGLSVENEIYKQFETLSATIAVLEGDVDMIQRVKAGDRYSFVDPSTMKAKKSYGASQEKADIEYAASEVKFKALTGKPKERADIYKNIMATLAELTTREEDITPSELSDLKKEFAKLFGNAPSINRKSIVFTPQDYGDFAAKSKQAGATSVPMSPNPFQTEKMESPRGIYYSEDDLSYFSGDDKNAFTPPNDRRIFEPVSDENKRSSVEERNEARYQNATQYRRIKPVPPIIESTDVLVALPDTLDRLNLDVPGVDNLNVITQKASQQLDNTANSIPDIIQIDAEKAAEAISLAIDNSTVVMTTSFEAVLTEVIKVFDQRIDKLKKFFAEANAPAAPASLVNYSREAGPRLLENLKGDIDRTIGELTPVQRTGTQAGNKLANRKSQVSKLKQQQTIDVEAVTVQPQDSPEYKKALQLANRVKEQKQLVLDLYGSSSPMGKQLAAEMKAAEESLIKEIEQLRLSQKEREGGSYKSETSRKFGGIKTSVRAAIKSVKKINTKGIVVGKEAVDDYIAGMVIASEEAISEANRIGQDIGEALDKGTRDALEERSPSKKGQERGRYYIEGIVKGGNETIPELAGVVKQVEEALNKDIKLELGGLQESARKGFQKILSVAKEASIDMGHSLMGGISDTRIESQFEKAYQMALEQSKMISGFAPHENEKENAVIAIGGLAGEKGKSSHRVAKMMEQLFDPSVAVDAIENVATDTSVDFSKKIHFAIEIALKTIFRDAIQGYNPDAIKAAALAIARKEATGVDSDFLGYSAGGFVARQAQQLSERHGVNSRAVGIGTPDWGVQKYNSDRYRSVMGREDILYPLVKPIMSSKSPLTFVDSGRRHSLSDYLMGSDTREVIATGLGRKIETPKGFTGIDGSNPFVNKKGTQDSSIGEYLALGLTKGYKKGIENLNNLIKQSANTTLEVMKDVFGIRSPSKKTSWIGEMLGLGLKEGYFKELKELASGLPAKIKASVIDPTLRGVKSGAGKAFDYLTKDARTYYQPDISTKRKDVHIPIPIIGEIAEEATSFFLDTLETMKNMATFAPKLGRALGGIGEALFKNRKLLTDVALGFAKIQFFVAPLMGVLNEFTQQAIQATAEIESLERTIQFTSGGESAGQDNINFVRAVTKDNRTSLRQGLAGYAGISASAKNTSLEGEATRQIFEAVTKASSAYSISPETQERAFVALSQMIDKQVVSMEELRGQLSEALPGAMAIAARSMNMGVREFQRFVSTGELMAEDFIPKFAQQLSAESSAGLVGSADTMVAAISRMDNAVLDLQDSFGRAVAPFQKFKLNSFAKGLELIKDYMAELSAVITGVLVVSLQRAVIQSALLSKSLANVAAIRALFVEGFFKEAITQIAQFALKVGVVVAAFAALKAIMIAVQDASQGMNILAEQSINRTKPVTESKTENNRTSQRTALEQVPFVSILPKNLLRSAEVGIQNLFGMKTYEEKIAEDMNVALGDLRMSTGSIYQKAISEFVGVSGDGIGSISEIKGIDEQLSELKRSRRGLNIDSDGERERIDAEINQLNSKRAEISAAPQAMQGEIAKSIEELNTAKSKLQDELNQGGLSEGRRLEITSQMADIGVEIEQSTKLLEWFNNTIGKVESSVAKLLRTFSYLPQELEQVNQMAEKNSIQNQIAIASDMSTIGVSGAQTEASTKTSVKYASERAIALRQNMSDRYDLMNSQESIDAFSSLEAFRGQSIKDVSSLDMRKVVESVIDDDDQSAQANLLRRLVEEKGIAEQQSVEVLSLDLEVAQAQRQLIEAVHEGARSLRDFFNQAKDNADQMALEAEAAQIQIDTSSQQNKLKEAVIGFQNSFIDGTVDGLIGLLDTLNQGSLEDISARQAILDVQTQMRDQETQAMDLQRSLPSSMLNGQLPPDESILPYLPDVEAIAPVSRTEMPRAIAPTIVTPSPATTNVPPLPAVPETSTSAAELSASDFEQARVNRAKRGRRPGYQPVAAAPVNEFAERMRARFQPTAYTPDRFNTTSSVNPGDLRTSVPEASTSAAELSASDFEQARVNRAKRGRRPGYQPVAAAPVNEFAERMRAGFQPTAYTPDRFNTTSSVNPGDLQLITAPEMSEADTQSTLSQATRQLEDGRTAIGFGMENYQFNDQGGLDRTGEMEQGRANPFGSLGGFEIVLPEGMTQADLVEALGGDPAGNDAIAEGMTQADLVEALGGDPAGNDAIAEGMALAEQAGQQQIEMARERQRIAEETAQIEASMQVEGILNQFREARRTIEDTGRGFEESLRGIERGLGEQSSIRDFRNNLADIQTGFEETMRNMEQFETQLVNTISTAQEEILWINNLVASGEMSQAMADQLLPGIQETIGVAQAQLQNARSMMAENERLVEQQKQQALTDMERGMEDEIISELQAGPNGQSTEVRTRVRDRDLERQNANFASQIQNLEEMRSSGEITEEQFIEMKAKAEELNGIKLDGIEREFKNVGEASSELKEFTYDVVGKMREFETRMNQELSKAASFRGDEMTSGLRDAKAQIMELGDSYKQELDALREAAENEELAWADFKRLKDELEELNAVSLDNLREELTSIDPGQIVSALNDLQNTDFNATEERKKLDNLKANIQEASGVLTPEQQRELNQAINIASQISGDSSGSALRQIKASTTLTGENQYLNEVLNSIGRSDVTGLMGLMQQNEQAKAIDNVFNEEMASGSSNMAEANKGIEERLDRLITATERQSSSMDRLASSPRSFTLNQSNGGGMTDMFGYMAKWREESSRIQSNIGKI